MSQFTLSDVENSKVEGNDEFQKVSQTDILFLRILYQHTTASHANPLHLTERETYRTPLASIKLQFEISQKFKHPSMTKTKHSF